MADIIDSDNQDELTSGNPAVAFNVPDLKALAAKILRRANDVANQKIEQAKESIKMMEQEAASKGEERGYAEGLKKGEADGRAAGDKAAREEFAAKVGPLLAAMQTLLQDLTSRKTELQAKAEADMLRLGMEVAHRIVRREIEVDDEFVVPIVREAVALTNNRSDLVVRMNPDDEKAILEELPNLHAIFSDLGRVQLEPDKKVDRGGVVVQNRQSEVDMKLWRQFEALERALVGDVGGLKLKVDEDSAVEAVPLPVNELPDSMDGDVTEIEPDASFEDVQKVLDENSAKQERNPPATEPEPVAPTPARAQAEEQNVPAEPAVQAPQPQPSQTVSEPSSPSAPQEQNPPEQEKAPEPKAEPEPPLDEFVPIATDEVPQGAELVADNKTIEEVSGTAENAPQSTGTPAATAPSAGGESSLASVKSVAQLPKDPATEKRMEQAIRTHIGNAKK